MNLDKLNAEIDKTRGKIETYKHKLAELERRRTEAENAQIVDLVRSVEATPERLAGLIASFRAGSPPLPAQPPDKLSGG